MEPENQSQTPQVPLTPTPSDVSPEQTPVQEVQPISQPKKKVNFWIVSTITLLVILITGGTLYFLNYQKTPLSLLSTPSSAPNPSPSSLLESSGLDNLTWKNEQWLIAGSFTEFTVPSVTYKIDFPGTWNFNNTIAKEGSLDCFLATLADPDNNISLTIDAICSGWASSDDTTSLPSEYKLIKKTEGTQSGQVEFKYLVRIKKADGTYTYIEGDNSSDNIESAVFTNAILITENITQRNTHSYFKPANITIKYSGNENGRENYLQIIDRVVSSLTMANVDYENN